MRRILMMSAAITISAPAFAHDDEEMRYRLIVADAEAPRLQVIDPQGEGMTQAMNVASPARVYMGPDAATPGPSAATPVRCI